MGTMENIDCQSWFGDRVALVTGASSGMGRAIALALGSAGAHVGVHYRRNHEGAKSVVDQIVKSGGQAEAISADITEPDEIHALFEKIEKRFDRPIEMLVNNAGDWMDKCTIMDCSIEQWEQVFAVNTRSVFLCCQLAARRMVETQTSGSIVNMGSVAGHTGGGGGTVPYAAAKGAVHAFTRGLSKELAPHQIRVNAIAPGMIETPMIAGRVSEEANELLTKLTPLGRFGQPEEIVGPVMMLLSPAGSYVTGQIIDVNGGLLMR